MQSAGARARGRSLTSFWCGARRKRSFVRSDLVEIPLSLSLSLLLSLLILLLYLTPLVQEIFLCGKMR
ncbi:hypothetical protein COCVIDRAFT_106360 [Bipolaris victoriae FI3]|uniref:Uncharacterized protein n=1 Tax=Bipolaris victoriae (strain FI3) TaxID=930091 RepID=W7EEM8_BIPV3|nr:hypothetical protein COCVIDRAFT_106360 [Bipolaris victoriae FI3]